MNWVPNKRTMFIFLNENFETLFVLYLCIYILVFVHTSIINKKEKTPKF